jgi:release factor glutamine methyltransferase
LRLQPISENASFDAQLLLAHVLDQPRAWLLAHPEIQLNEKQVGNWEDSLARLEQGEALPYILGEWDFYGLPFTISPDVLIPRPETELLVERAIKWLQANDAKIRVLEVGTGSACIAISLASALPHLKITATDISEAALKVAAINIDRHNVNSQVSLLHADMLDGITGSFDLICANLPYIPSPRLPELAVAQREPLLALDGGLDGLEFIQKFLAQSAQKLAQSGLLLAEIDDSHHYSVLALAKEHFPLAHSQVFNDFAGKPRLLQIST